MRARLGWSNSTQLGELSVQLLDRAAPIFGPNICQNLQKITLNLTNPTLQPGTFVETLRGTIDVIGSVEVLVGLAGAFTAYVICRI